MKYQAAGTWRGREEGRGNRGDRREGEGGREKERGKVRRRGRETKESQGGRKGVEKSAVTTSTLYMNFDQRAMNLFYIPQTPVKLSSSFRH